MNLTFPSLRPTAGDDRLRRAIRRRLRVSRLRVGQAVLITALAWFATHDLLAFAWLGAALGFGGLEALVGRRALADDRASGAAIACQALSSLSFSSVALVLLRTPDAIRLAEAVFVLCATGLGNALQSSRSPAATAALVTPPIAILAACPLWVGFAGSGLPLSDTLLLALSGLAFGVFIVRLSATFHAEGEALRHARREAEDGAQRWGMIFDHSPLARLCFDAAPLYTLLQAHARGRTRLGDVLRTEVVTVEALTRLVRLIEANQSAQDLLGRGVAEAHVTPAFLGGFCTALNAMDEHGVLPPFEAEIVLADGRNMVVQAHYRMSTGGEAPWSLCLATYADLTESHRVARGREEARVAAEEANRAKSDFLAVMSHEIRTPLNGVLGMAQAMEAGPLAPAQRERVKVIRQSGAALMDLLDDLLDLSTIEAGRLSLESHDFDLRAAVEAAHAAFAAEAAAKGLDFSLEIDPAIDGLWRGDSGRVRQVLSNLISNAVKFTHRGHVRVRLAKSASGVRLEVADSGIGIAPDRVARLFEKFTQADASATRAYGGTGLGLAICQEICRAMGGAITVGSAPGHGSDFTLELPLRQISQASPAAAGPMVLEGPMRVLAAEDNPVNRMVLKALLGQFELEPTLVENGAEAVRAWESSHWDLILMDVQMPVMDGITATMTIRAREAMTGRLRTPIVAVTANTMAHQVASYRAAGMDDVVGKPINVTDLFAAMLSAMNREDEAVPTRLAS